MRRRSVLLGVAALAAGSGCVRALGDDPVEVRVMRPENPDAADAHCQLSASFVERHEVLERVLESAATAPTGEWVVAGTDRATGDALLEDLRSHCEDHGGVYHFDGNAYRLRVQTSDGTPLEPTSGNTEAIRGVRPDDSV